MWRNVQLINEPKTKMPIDPMVVDKGYCWEVHGILQGHVGTIIGVDPGVNFGITLIEDEKLFILNGKLKTQENRIHYSVLAKMLIESLTTNMLNTPTCILEGAAFNKTFGQVNLAEVRAGYYIGMEELAGNVTMVAPMSCRKKVFGDGRTQAMDIWPQLNHNASDSLAIALYALS